MQFSNLIGNEYNLKISINNTETVAFHGQYPVRDIIIVEDYSLERVQHLNYLMSYITFSNDRDIERKL